MTWSMLLASGNAGGNRKAADIPASTHGVANARDLSIADRITATLHLQRDRLVLDDAFWNHLGNRWPEFVSRTEGLFPLTQISSFGVIELLSQQFQSLIASYGAALYRRQIKKFIEPRIDPTRDIAEQVLPYELTSLARAPFIHSEAKNAMKSSTLHGLRAYYDKLEGIGTVGDRFDLFYADQAVALRDSAEILMQEENAIEAVSRISGAIRRKEGIHHYIIRHSFPQLERFPLDYSGFQAPYRGFSTLRLVAPGLEKVHKSMTGIIPLFQHFSFRKPPIDTRSILLPRLANAREILLSRHPFFESLIDRAALERTLNEMTFERFEHGDSLLQLLTFKLYLDIFH
ncbi:MAG TPA: hypothetical protein VGM92_15125 [Candidatus Kapabacteria bacterium]|jgi:hypothetical protein